MAETKWEVGDKFRANAWPKKGYRTFTVVQVLDDDKLLVGYFARDEARKPYARYGIKNIERYGWSKYRDEPKSVNKKYTAAQARALFNKADAAGTEAGRAAIPTPMYVGTPKNMMASLTGGDDGGFDKKEPVYFVSEGACGFAWVTIRPGTSSLARQWQKLGLARPAYKGGMRFSVRYGGQSLERKSAYARAFAQVLTDEGVTAYSGSRMD